MNIELIPINDLNKDEILNLKTSDLQKAFIASNEKSLDDAKENPDVARPFGIYSDGKAVGFCMFAFEPDYEDPNDRYYLWRFMIDEKYQGLGYGKEALKHIIEYLKNNGASNIRLLTKESNLNAIGLYESLGFKKTGEMIDDENQFELNFI